MDYDQPLFRWDRHGISAFSADASSIDGLDSITNFNSKKFVRFDKNGIYGISDKIGIDGLSGWYPGKDTEDSAEVDINKKATFALTWDGLKVTNDNNVTLHIGDSAKVNPGDETLLSIKDGKGNTTFAIKNNGTLTWGGADAGSSPTQVLYSATASTNEQKPVDGKEWRDFDKTTGLWHREI
jgi:hypothetical protein